MPSYKYGNNDSPLGNPLNSNPQDSGIIASAIDSVTEPAFKKQSNEALRSELPANEQEDNSQQVNWLGSSYSGVDLKVVAHLYDPLSDGEVQSKRDRVQKEMEYSYSLADTAKVLASNVSSIGANNTTWAQRNAAFRRIIGSNNRVDTEQIYNQLVSGVLSAVNFSSNTSIARAMITLERIADDARALTTSLEKRLTDMESVENAGTRTVVLGNLQTISVQSHREKYPVRALGHAYAKGYTRGTRTIAGSMIFTLFDEHAFAQLIRSMGQSDHFKSIDEELSTLLPDQLPPIDITLAFANEYGATSRMGIYGVEFLNDGATFSIEDLLSENVVNFVARDVDVLTKTGNIRLSKMQRGQGSDSIQYDSASNRILNNENYEKYLQTLRLRRRITNR
jgi:hypothetical protein